MDHRARPTPEARDHIFASDCDGCAKISDAEKRDVKRIADLAFDRVVRVLEMRIVGAIVKPIAKDMVDKFVTEMDAHSLRGRHIGLVAQHVLRRLDGYLRSDKK